MPPVPTTRCRACGSPTAATERFCRSCGNDLAAPVDLVDLRDPQAERTEVMADAGLGLPSTADGRGGGHRPPVPVPVPGKRRAGVLLVTLGVLLIVAGMVGSWAVIEGKIKPPATGSTPSGGAPTVAGGTGPSPAPPPGPSGSAGSSGSPGSSGPSGTPGPVVVRVAPALQARAETPGVVALLSAYFTAINRRDFEAAQRTLVPRAGLPTTAAEFRRRYRSTVDSDVVLVGLRAGPDRDLVASVTFTSQQAPVDSPDRVSSCLRWSIDYPLVQADGGLRIDEVRKSNQVHRRC
jgi:hypothetical protein